MSAAEAGDREGVRALTSRSILNLYAPGGALPGFHTLICEDERERLAESAQSLLSFSIPKPFVPSPACRRVSSLREHALNACAPDGRTPLMFAAEKGHAAIVRHLIKVGASMWALNDKGDTAVSLAARNGHLEVVHTFLKELPVLTYLPEGGRLALLFADSLNSPAVKEALANAHADELKLIDAAKDIQCLRQIICGKDAAWLNSALRTVAGHGLSKPVEVLILAGADVNATTESGLTALLVAVTYGRLEAVKTLLAHGAKINACCNSGHGVLSHAIQGGWREILSLFLANKSVKKREGLSMVGLGVTSTAHRDPEHALNSASDRDRQANRALRWTYKCSSNAESCGTHGQVASRCRRSEFARKL